MSNTTDVVTTPQPQQPPQPPIVILRQRLEARENELRNALPDDVSPKQFIRVVTTAATINPEILACSFQSIWKSCMLACRDGLLPDGVEAAFVPYKSECSYQSMYRGLLLNFRRSGMFRWIVADVVREGDGWFH
jgi:recombinational DNA repair protein RecT